MSPPPRLAPARRQGGHAWQCNGDIRDWPAEWFTQDWYLDNKSLYDEIANQGIVYPPWSVWGSLCPSPTFPTSTISVVPNTTSLSTRSTAVSSVVVPTAAQGASSLASTSTSGTVAVSIPSTPTPTPSPTRSPSLAAFSTVSSTTSTTGSSIASPPTPSPANLGFTPWDYQAKGTVVAAAAAIGVGALLWGLWALLIRLKQLYAPRSWFLPPGSRPPASTIAAMLLPFLHLPPLNAPASDAQVMSHVGASALGIAVVSAVVGVGILLPLSIANVPHLSVTTPQNARGGKLGSLTDLSLLRLLNAHSPPLLTPAAGTQFASRGVLSSTTPMEGSRIRLIVILVLIAVLSVGGTLFIVWRTYAKLFAYSIRFDEASEGQSMVFIPASEAPAWKGLTETGIHRQLTKEAKDSGSVAGVFAIGGFDSIKEMTRERAHVLNVLEEAEALYIKSFPAFPSMPGNVNRSPPCNSRRVSSRLSFPLDSSSSSASLSGQLADFDPPGEGGSVFLEVEQRQSVMRRSGKFNVGDSVIRDEDGTFLPAKEPEPPKDLAPATDVPSPPSLSAQDFVRATRSSAQDLVAVLDDSRNRESYMTLSSDLTPPPTTRGDPPLSVRPQSILAPAILADLRAKITWSRARLQKLNMSIDKAQQEAMKEVATGTGATVGWIIVGRGVTSLPCAVELPGRTKEDILWDNLEEPVHCRIFWPKAASLAGVLGLIFVPFLVLAVSSAPGFAHHVQPLKPLARSDGFDSGVAESLVPAIAIIVLVCTGIELVQYFVRQTRPASNSELRFRALKGVTYLLLIIGTIWVITLGAILYGIDAYTENVGKAAAVADGVMFITWLSLVLVINLCILPGAAALQPQRLLRWVVQRRRAVTPRQRFQHNLPPNYNPATALAPLLAGMFYLFALCGVFPLISVPVLLLAYLSLVAHQWLTTRVFCVTRGGMADARAGLWALRRLGWAAGLQPFVFGLVLLSRREWALGGAGLGITAAAVAMSELLTVSLHRRRPTVCFSGLSLTDDSDSFERTQAAFHKRVESDHSALARFHILLPGLGRLAADNPLPFSTDAIDDYLSTERAMQAAPNATTDAFGASQTSVVVTPPADSARGLIYPPELLQPAPTVWLPRGQSTVAEQEVDALAMEGLTAVVDQARGAQR
ncbi:hypothetical protein CC85DRAFT_327652 [Cutaneotrichosporon oleaginosum]|uniref:CSC1/OSCA1-like 7TM region domain-containing protein n=1 Tax=Cutaneotrichosporon oleaginosum TaxID=879819 RepID=A0A0J0XPT8_9TREE|nr:uncharacterized protein CC85DRAFT_327652 [Cutaneotrichosporon oleaginosum]KLT43141.1 hypothetical protein CC85DRAFT_327652 [Cutaneotrichosporon oleaginosum]TXT10068.1 hypothetical protein COLE_04002 [Cutaneotrichosporon oleaginosum]